MDTAVDYNDIWIQPSPQQVVFPLCMPLRVQTDERETLKKSLPLIGSNEHAATALSLSNTTTLSQPEPGQQALKLPFKGRKV